MLQTSLLELGLPQLAAAGLVFVWSGFVRAGLGFGGSVLTLPLLLIIVDQPLFWLPILSLHLLFFSAVTLHSRLDNVDWVALRRSIPFILPAKLIGVFGLLSLPNHWLIAIIYGITTFYALLWVSGREIASDRPWLDRLMLVAGGYFSGTSLSGAPLIVAYYARRIRRHSLRDTLFVLWFLLVSIKLATLIWFDVDPQIAAALLLVPVAAIGHFVGMKAHDYLIENDGLFKRALGLAMIAIVIVGTGRLLG